MPSKSSESDPPENEDEWGGGEEEVVGGNDYGTAGVNGNETDDDKLGDLKRCLVDTFYGTELGFTAFSELLPLIATGKLPLVVVKQISQSINTTSLF
ncbi:hypothetical protein MKX01_017327, partial [Papaver californicum]